MHTHTRRHTRSHTAQHSTASSNASNIDYHRTETNKPKMTRGETFDECKVFILCDSYRNGTHTKNQQNPQQQQNCLLWKFSVPTAIYMYIGNRDIIEAIAPFSSSLLVTLDILVCRFSSSCIQAKVCLAEPRFFHSIFQIASFASLSKQQVGTEKKIIEYFPKQTEPNKQKSQ